jgi:uncharacterized protein
MEKERFYKATIVLLAALVLVMGLVLFLRRPAPVSKPRPVSRRTKIIKPRAGKIAIVIDDVGYSQANFKIIEDIKFPVTFAILPGLDFSEDAARQFNSRGFQVILHLPMEPKEKTNLENNTVLTSMDKAAIRSIIEKDLSTVPHARGVSNHMGSRGTEDENTMSAVLGELKDKHLFFLDSFVTVGSSAGRLSENKQVKFVKRDVFLDNSADPDYIRQQLSLLKQKAGQKGQAVGIGHDRKNTLEVLRQEMPKIEKEGFEFVFVSELAR